MRDMNKNKYNNLQQLIFIDTGVICEYFWRLIGEGIEQKSLLFIVSYILSKIMVLFHWIDDEKWLYYAAKIIPQTDSLFRF